MKTFLCLIACLIVSSVAQASGVPIVNNRGQIVGYANLNRNQQLVLRDRSGRVQQTITPVRGRVIIQDNRGIRK